MTALRGLDHHVYGLQTVLRSQLASNTTEHWVECPLTSVTAGKVPGTIAITAVSQVSWIHTS